MQVIRNLFRGYRGGPDFSLMRSLEYTIGDSILFLELPYSNPVLQETPKVVNYPLDDNEWFERHSEQMGHRTYIAVHGNTWYYYPLIASPFRGELGDLILNISIEKLPKNHTKNILLPDELGKYLLNQYNDYYNSPVVGEYALGWNTDIKNRVKKQSGEMCAPYSSEELEDLIQLRLSKIGFPDVNEYSVVTYNQKQWVHHQYKKDNTQQFYSLALTKDYYLTVKFRFSTNLSSEDTFWYKDAIKASHRIMENIRIKEDVLISHASD